MVSRNEPFHSFSITVLVCSASDNSKFVSGGGDRTIFYWDVTTGQTIRRIPGHNSRVNAVALNEDASVAVSGLFSFLAYMISIHSFLLIMNQNRLF